MARGLGLVALALVLAVWATAPVASEDICGKCACQEMTPYLVDCSQLKLDNHFREDDWNETIIKRNLTGKDLDVRFDMNLINSVHRFPALNIVSLQFTNNSINYVEESAFADLTRLKNLDLSHNRLTAKSLPEWALWGVFNGSDNYYPLPIEHLSLAHNDIHSVDKNIFDHLPYLQTLDMSSNPLKLLEGSTSQAISDLHSLKVLDLANTSLKSIPLGLLHALPDLETLDLANNRFTEVPDEISNNHNLTVLVLNGNKFHTLNANSFVGLDKLDELEISDMPTLKEIESGTFGPMKKLRVLKCQNNRKLTKISDAAFLGITEKPEGWPVRELYLSNNGLHVLDKAMANWEFIDIVDIQSNPFRCDCKIQWLAETLLPEIVAANPQLTKDIMCRDPESIRGRALISLSYEHEEFLKCTSDSSNSLYDDIDIPINGYQYQAAGIVILAIGVILIVIGLSILTVIVVKRRAIAHALMAHHQIRYERADQDEEEFNPYGNTRKF